MTVQILAKQTHICGVDSKPYELAALQDGDKFKITARGLHWGNQPAVIRDQKSTIEDLRKAWASHVKSLTFKSGQTKSRYSEGFSRGRDGLSCESNDADYQRGHKHGVDEWRLDNDTEWD